MMTQEEYMDLVAMRHKGKTLGEIADELGYHPATVSKWLQSGGPPPKRSVAPRAAVVDERWAARVGELLEESPKLLASSLYMILRAEGFTGSYPTLVRHVRERRGPRFRPGPQVSVPIETAPGQECQFDWSDCSEWTGRWGLGEVHCFGAVLCWSRWRRWWFAPSLDRQHTFEGLVAFFESAGGTTRVARTDRMGALGTAQGHRFALHPPTIEFCRHHSLELAPCKARDAKRKGKVERPFRDLKETFLAELQALGAPGSVAELNVRAAEFLATRVHARPHSTTGVPPAQRLETERAFLSPLPRRRFDTAYAEDRRVHPRLPFVSWGGVAYSVPPEALGYKVTCRVEVGTDVLEVCLGRNVVARHVLQPGASGPVWEPAHRQAAERAALGLARPALTVVPGKAPEPVGPSRLSLNGDYDVEPPDLAARYGGCECTGRLP